VISEIWDTVQSVELSSGSLATLTLIYKTIRKNLFLGGTAKETLVGIYMQGKLLHSQRKR
jgi:hypothetical protein